MDAAFVATAFATAFTIIDPIGMIPMTLAATRASRPERRNQIIDQAVIVAAGVILFMGVVGRLILNYLGITLPAFTIAGGILLFLIAIDMLFARPTGAKAHRGRRTRGGADRESRGLSAGGSDDRRARARSRPSCCWSISRAAIALDLSSSCSPTRSRSFVTWLCMRGSSMLLRVIGTTGIHVISRLLGIILAALAVQFVLNGLGADAAATATE